MKSQVLKLNIKLIMTWLILKQKRGKSLDTNCISDIALEPILNGLAQGIVIINKDGTLFFVNETLKQLYHVNPEIQLKTHNDILKQITLYTIDGKQYLFENLPARQVFLKGTTQQDTFIVQRADGSRLMINAVAKPVKDDNGNIIAAIALIEDISERKKAEETLRQAQAKLQEYTSNLEAIVENRTKQINESEQRYRELYESFGEAFIAVDWELNVIHWNKTAERVTSVRASEALGKKVYAVLPEFLTVDVTPFFETLRQNKPARFMMNATSRETKKPSIFEISTYPSKQGIIIIVEDKTEEEQNMRLSTIGATAGMVGHDIRNPLQAIANELFLAKESMKKVPDSIGKQEVLDSVDFIEQQLDYINKIVADLQDYARPLRPEYSMVDFSEVVNKIFNNLCVPDSIKLSIKVKDCPKFSTDPTLLQRALSNLVTNAIQAMSAGGDLEIIGRPIENKVLITISDTGTGIPDEIKPKLFTPMITTKAKGQGFGLAVAKRLIEAMKGTINFESEEGKGTKFIIELPING